MRVFVCAAFVGTLALPAMSEACTETVFSGSVSEQYMKAEIALIEEDNATKALDITDDLWTADLNCYERQSLRKLRAASFVEINNSAGAIDMLLPLLEDDASPASDRARTAYNIGQLYSNLGEAEKAQHYLEMSDALGGFKPS
ncbi:hypothetical protein [Henriciella marina]|uniref:hypothetical protein n=1 Tax=Henriciella marina TaxID=453851 RepID=UPI0012EA64DB|nr:hypothetical protein [Henriciella marina]